MSTALALFFRSRAKVTASYPRVNSYRHRVHGLLRSTLGPYLPFQNVLDFGCGDGWFAYRFEEDDWANQVVAVDVASRQHPFTNVQLYDGRNLPFEDRSFELSYGIDALHHCEDPRQSLEDLLRCTGKLLLLKDHTHRSWAGWLALAALDEIGNRRFRVASRYRYQRGWDWLSIIEGEGFEQLTLIHPAACHTGLLGRATNSLQFVGLWRRK
jgi:SAM-dependent methyltransferase